MAISHGAVCLGPDEIARRFFDWVGIGPDAVAVVRFRHSSQSCTIALPTFRTWGRNDLRRRTAHAASSAFAAGRNVVVQDPGAVKLQPRLCNAEHMLRSMRVPAMGDAATLSRLLSAQGGEASLAECEAALASPFADGRIFGLMVGGHVEIDLSVPLSADSLVRLRPPGWPFAEAGLGRTDTYSPQSLVQEQSTDP